MVRIAKEGIIIELIDGRKIAFDYKSLMKVLRSLRGVMFGQFDKVFL